MKIIPQKLEGWGYCKVKIALQSLGEGVTVGVAG